MKQILQTLNSGEILLADVPSPSEYAGCMLIIKLKSLVSIGSEKMLFDYGSEGWIAKVCKQSDKLKQVLKKLKTDGSFPTLHGVKSKLDQPNLIGWYHIGRVAARL